MGIHNELNKESLQQDFAENLKYLIGVDSHSATKNDYYTALAYTIRNRLINQWLQTQRTHYEKDVKRVYYLSLEFLMGRSLGNNIINIGLEDTVRNALEVMGHNFNDIEDVEVDAGLGNGGLGRLAACFIESMATLDIPAFGYGLRYDYGIFRQVIENGQQVEFPDDWLQRGNPWEIKRADITIPVHFGGRCVVEKKNTKKIYRWVDTETVIGIAYDTPIVGYRTNTVNTLRLWSAHTYKEFNFSDFNAGEYVTAVEEQLQAANLTKVLYPNDTLYLGKKLRLKQQYFFVACSLADIVRRFKKQHKNWTHFPSSVAIQLNDTHPSLSVVELMRILVDEEGLEWNSAWNITINSMAYTNHTLMREALEKWPVSMFETVLPRHLQIIYEINYSFLQEVSKRFPGDSARIRDMSIIEEGPPKMVRMVHLAIVGSHSTNGVAELHSKLLKTYLVPQFADMWPERFNNKTNGITQRRFLLKANPALSQLLSKELGDTWVCDLSQLKKLHSYAQDASFQKQLAIVKQKAKNNLITYLKNEHSIILDPSYIFDVQVKRIHEYKRQLLNALHIIMLYSRIREGKTAGMIPRVFLFSGKAAPGYVMAKLIIKLINNIAHVINTDPQIRPYLQVYFLPNYCVSLAERLIPATDVSEQISTAGTEASGTGNMKFMANGAITVGTLDGANIEIQEEVGEDNIFIFGLNAKEVEELRPNYVPQYYYEHDTEIKMALDLLFSGHFDGSDSNIFMPIQRMLFEGGDYYMHLADLRSYAQAHENILKAYKNKKTWGKMITHNIAGCGKFSSDRTITEYAKNIWQVDSCPVTVNSIEEDALREAIAKKS